MYIHLVPTIIDDFFIGSPKLFSVEIPELNLKLTQEQLSQGKPYTNKKYIVGFSKSKSKKIGLLLKTNKKLDKFTTIYTWKVSDIYFKHTIHNIIEDHENELFSQYLVFSLGHYISEENQLTCRMYKGYEGMSIVSLAPVFRQDITKFSERDNVRSPNDIIQNVYILQEANEYNDNLEDSFIYVSEIIDEIHLHSIETDRLLKCGSFKQYHPALSETIVVD